MQFKLVTNSNKNTVRLHNGFESVYCPFPDTPVTCGSWCALFHLSKERSCLDMACCNKTVYLTKEE